MVILLFCNGCGIVKGYKILKKENCCKTGELSKDYHKNNSISQKEFEIAMNNFKNSEGEYSDDYGGCFIDDQGLLNICFVDDLQLLVKNFYINNFIKKLKYCSCFCKNLVL
jgi:hypothetical protein